MATIGYLRSPSTQDDLERTGFLDEFEVFKPYFASVGLQLVAVDWRDADVDWKQFAYVIPKNAWDYFNHYSEFQAWLSRMDAEQVRLKNGAAIIRWNSSKDYLVELSKKGAAVAPLTIIRSDAELDGDLQRFSSYPRIVIKPLVSGGGKQTKVFSLKDRVALQETATIILQECPVILQPYFEEIAEGEWSFFFFGGHYSHAVIKIPKAGDFRAHKLFDATTQAIQPSQNQIQMAQSYFKHLSEEPHYARVDGIFVKEKFLLIELELIEPYLYLEYAHGEAVSRFVKAIVAD